MSNKKLEFMDLNTFLVILYLGQLCSHPHPDPWDIWQHLETFLVVITGVRRGLLLAWSGQRPRKVAQHPEMYKQPSTTKDYLFPNVSSEEVKISCFGWTITHCYLDSSVSWPLKGCLTDSNCLFMSLFNF